VREWSARREEADRSRVSAAMAGQRRLSRRGQESHRRLEEAACALDLGGKIALTRGAMEGEERLPPDKKDKISDFCFNPFPMYIKESNLEKWLGVP
jgi:hypothetical protein